MDRTRTITRCLLCCSWLIVFAPLQAAEAPPGIAITGTIDNSAKQVPILKMDYQACVMTHRAAQAAMEQGGVASAAVMHELPPGYQVGAKPQPEPRWEETQVGKSRFEEYFEGDKYARYTYGASHTFSEDGRCRLEKTEFVSMELDDGQEKYRIKLDGRLGINSADGSAASPVPMKYEYAHGKVRRQPSPVRSRAEVNHELQKVAALMQEHPELMRQLRKGLTPQTEVGGSSPPGGVGEGEPAPGSIPASGGDTLYRVKETLGYKNERYEPPHQTMLTNSFVAGQACDIVTMGSLKSRIWYWHRMNNYPATVSRPIILKKQDSAMHGETFRTTYKAESFRSGIDIDDAYFKPEPNLRKTGRW